MKEATEKAGDSTGNTPSASGHASQLPFKPWRVIAVLMLSIILIESAIMLCIHFILPPLSVTQETFLDIGILAPFLAAILYWFVLRPMQKNVHSRNALYNELSGALNEISTFDAELAHKLLHDELTGLPNRLLFHDRVEHEIKVAGREVTSFALFFMDPGPLSVINETLGHAAGDKILQHITDRLTHLVRKSDTLARMGGDEFALLMPTVDIELTEEMAGRIHNIFNEPFYVDDVAVDMTINIGVSLFPRHAESSVDLMRRADMAMRHAKREVSDTIIYDELHESSSLSRREAFRELRKAVANKEFELFYQPKKDTRIGRIVSAEALVRLSGRTNISPAEFIPLAEQTGLIHELGLWVLEHAIKQIAQWQHEGIDITVAVNISARNLLDVDLCQKIETFLSSYTVDKSKLSLELTESMLMEHPEASMNMLRKLDAADFHLSIDDYGTGYSSLSYLQQVPAKELKIDQAFIRNMTSNENDALIVHSTIELAHGFGMTVVAEGVEDIETYDRLAELGCDKVQGYYINRPLSAKDFTDWFRSGEN